MSLTDTADTVVQCDEDGQEIVHEKPQDNYAAIGKYIFMSATLIGKHRSDLESLWPTISSDLNRFTQIFNLQNVEGRKIFVFQLSGFS